MLMKLMTLGLLLSLVGCGSWSKQFKRKDVCSDQSLAYLKSHKAQYVKNDDKRVKKKVSKIEDEVKTCYKAEYKRHKWGKPTFNLCLVAGYDKAGTMDYFEFSSKDYRMSPEMMNCLSMIKSNKGLKGLKNITFVQPYRLAPRKSKTH